MPSGHQSKDITMLNPEVARSVERIAIAHGIDPNALKAVVEVESNGQPPSR